MLGMCEGVLLAPYTYHPAVKPNGLCVLVRAKGGKLDWCVFGICITVVLYWMSVPQYSLIGYLVSISILKPYRECYLISQTLHIAACLY